MSLTWSRACFVFIPLVFGFMGCRQLLGVDESQPVLVEETDAGSDAGDEGAGTDGGSPFTVFHGVPSGEELLGIWGTGAAFFVAVGTSSLSYIYRDGELTKLGGNQIGRDYGAVWGFSETDIFAVGHTASGTGFVDHFDGRRWTSVFESPTGLLGIWGSKQGAGAVIAVGGGGNMYGYSPGKAWAPFASALPAGPRDPPGPSSPRLWSMSGRSVADFSIAADSRFFHLEGKELAFYEPTTQTNTLFRSVWQEPGSETSVYFGTNYFGLLWFSARADDTEGYPGTVLFRDEATPGAESGFIQSVWGTAAKIVAVGDYGRIYVHDKGLSTTFAVPSPTDEALTGVWGSSLDDVWIVGGRELILHGSVR